MASGSNPSDDGSAITGIVDILAAAAGRLLRPASRSLPLLVALAWIVPPAPAAAQADTDPGSRAQELYIDQLGCSGCHGRSGEGGVGPTLAETGLTLSKFVKQVRLPSDVMPPFSPILASDVQLAAIYGWLGGADTVASPPPVVVELEGFGEMTAGSEAEASVTARRSEEGGASEPAAETPLRYRITLLARDNTPVAGHALAYSLSGGDAWQEAGTDRDGRALLGPDEGVAASDVVGEEGATTGLRLSLPAGSHAVVVEALDWSDPAAPVALGVGTAVVELE